MTQDGTGQAISVRPNLVVGWLRANLVLTDTMVSGSTPNTIFGLIPAGRTDIAQPLNRVTRVQVSTEVNGARILIALVLLLMAYLFLDALIFSLIVVLIAVTALATSYRTELVITDSGGGIQRVSVSPLDKEAVQGFADSVSQRLAAQG